MLQLHSKASQQHCLLAHPSFLCTPDHLIKCPQDLLLSGHDRADPFPETHIPFNLRCPLNAVGLIVCWCLQPFDCAEVLYFDYKHLDEDKEKELGCKFAEMDDLIKKCDVITVNLPLTDKTK